MTVELWQYARPKGRSARWAFRVAAHGAVVFESAWVSVRYRTPEDAAWLAGLIDALAGQSLFPGCPGRLTPAAVDVRWDGDPDDDCWAAVGALRAHAEHMAGPVRGGLWYCSVYRASEPLFHTAHRGVEPRSGVAARWLCELVICAAGAGESETHVESSAAADSGSV